MSSPGAVGLEEHFLCSICLEFFTDPVCTPCEHNFCKPCITKHWDSSSECQCPLCKKSFSVRPYLRVNHLFSQIVSQVKKQAQRDDALEVKTEAQGQAKADAPKPRASKAAVQCDICSEPKLKALKSCLVCLSSFCETHLQPHLTVSGLKKHQLMEPVENLEDRMCPTHQRPLELFCGTDEELVCMMCSVLEHKNHHFLPLKDAFEEQKASLEKGVSKSKRLVKKRMQKIKEVQAAMELTKKQADKTTAGMVKVFSEIVESVQRRLDDYTELVEGAQSKHEKRAQSLISELEEEIHELEKRIAHAERLSRSHDPLHFLQRCTALTPPAGLKEWSGVSVEPATFEGMTARALAALDNDLSQTRNRILDEELKRVQKFAVDVTLDPDTAHCNLVLSKDKKKVHYREGKKKCPENKERFSESFSVLGQPSFSSGRFYFEVQVEENGSWKLGVAKESVERKGKITLKPSSGFWAMSLNDAEEYRGLDEAPVLLSPQHPPQKLGVFVDHIEGIVSFHDADTAELVFSFSDCDFAEDVVPYFSPSAKDGKSSASLVIVAMGGAENDPPTRRRQIKLLRKAESKDSVTETRAVTK